MTESLFDEPSISRQWVLRRLQQALTLDLAAGALLDGLARTCARSARTSMDDLAEAAHQRAATVREIILDEGGTPYSSVGLARACSRAGGFVLGPISLIWRPGLRLLAEHTLQEYDALAAQLRSAPGISPDLRDRAQPLFESAQQGHRLADQR